jgi:3-deoxy-D-manno-octulosonate 8-phosphate phosphatase KdsC-like HAD superfamily phosphatase
VAENGALLYRPATKETKLLAEPPPPAFLAALEQQNVVPLAAGEVIVATWTPHETTVLETIRQLGLELQVIFNKGAVMVLPSGVNKRTGLKEALDELEVSPHNAVAIGDGENDHALLSFVECGAAVANALPFLKEHADVVMLSNAGNGVIELIERLVADDLADLEPSLSRHEILLGHRDDGTEVRLKPYGQNVLLIGPSGSGKSTLTTGLLERLAEQRYQYCLVDPEGDYEELDEAVSLGDSTRPPTVDEIMQLLRKPRQNASINLVGVTLSDRPLFFANLVAGLQELRARAARPHWIVIDEAHHVLPHIWAAVPLETSIRYKGIFMITVTPDEVAPKALEAVDLLLAVGTEPLAALEAFGRAVGQPVPATAPQTLEKGEAVAWFRGDGELPFRFKVAPSHQVLRRHRRKYAVGSVGAERAFYFRGPQGKLNLRAQNLQIFLQMAEGVDDATWLHHLRRGDYSDWLRETIKDEALADEVESVENTPGISADESRRLIAEAIESRYTAPATGTRAV